ncbi:hypothetical protein K502DRAFT_352014 [Neoconidiobolus thromboides FSU 785]|nr:hypothetical protein K502DRAFT_352014 [Neoconidiobolus thromboides FSU 785]
MMDLSTIGFQEHSMNNYAKLVIEKLKYHLMIKIKRKSKLEIGFKSEEDRESALNQEWEVNGYKVETYKAWDISEIIMRLTILNFGDQFIRKELDIYGKVILCTQELDNEKIYYTDGAVVFLIPNKFLVGKDLPLAICIYEPPEVKCIHCGKNDHKSIQCETTQGFESLFISTEDNSNGYVKIGNNE